MDSLAVATHNALISTTTMYAQILDSARKANEATVALLHMKLAELEAENKALKARNEEKTKASKHPLDL